MSKAQKFCDANDQSLVVSGFAHEPDPRKPARGITYTLDDGRSFRLSAADCVLPEGYPKWKLP